MGAKSLIGSRWVNQTSGHRGLEVQVVRLTPNRIKVRVVKRSRSSGPSKKEKSYSIPRETFHVQYRPL